MPNVPGVGWSNEATSDLLGKAAALLAREVARLPSSFEDIAKASPPDLLNSFAGRTCPVTGTSVPATPPDKNQLRQEGLGLLDSLRDFLKQSALYAPAGSHARPRPPAPVNVSTALPGLERVSDLVEPTGLPSSVSGFDWDRLRSQAHGFIETLLATIGQATGERGLPAESQVPLIQCATPVPAGSEASATLRVSNEEDSASEVTLYTTNFVADSGFEIPSLRVRVSPRRVTIPPKGSAAFGINVAVPQQTPAGTYSGLIQAMGSKYVKAVLSVQVL
jgi:hypothetical protein